MLFSRDDLVLANTLFYLSVMNMMLGLFNLLPGFPMDGGRIFRSAMIPFAGRVKATYYAMIVGRVFAVVLGLVGAWRVLSGLNWGFVTLLIAWMIWKEGYREYLVARMETPWGCSDYRAKASPPPYGGAGGESDVNRD
jgi:Zn-dependent protease